MKWKKSLSAYELFSYRNPLLMAKKAIVVSKMYTIKLERRISYEKIGRLLGMSPKRVSKIIRDGDFCKILLRALNSFLRVIKHTYEK